LRRLSGNSIETLEPSTLSREEQDSLIAITNRVRIDWAGDCDCPAVESFQTIQPFSFVPIAPASSRHAFWASAIRDDGVVVGLSSAFVHVFDRNGVEHRSPAFSDFTIDGLHPLSDGRFLAWGIDDTLPLFESTQTFIIDVSDPARPSVQQTAVTGWPEHTTFRLTRWSQRPDGRIRVVGTSIPSFSGSVNVPAVADCTPEGLTLRCTPLQTLPCRDSDFAVTTVNTPDSSILVTRRAVQSATECTVIGREIEDVTMASGIVLTEFQGIRQGTQDDEWVYLCATFAQASIVYAAPTAQIADPTQWRVLPLNPSCNEDNDFVRIDGELYFMGPYSAFGLSDGAVQAEVSLENLYGLRTLSPVQAFQHASAGAWTLAGFGFGDLVLARREAGGQWAQLRSVDMPFSDREEPFGFGDRELFTRRTTDIDAAAFGLNIRAIGEPGFRSLYDIQVFDDEILVAGVGSNGAGRVEVFTRELLSVWSQTIGTNVTPFALARLDDRTLVVGTNRGLWYGDRTGFSRVSVEDETPEGWTWDIRGGPGGVWAQSNAQIYHVQPALAVDAPIAVDRYFFDFIRGYTSPCPSHLLFVDNSMRTFVLAELDAFESSPERVFAQRRARSLIANDEFNTNLRGRATDIIRRQDRALILTTQNLLLSAGA
ncbi:MAG: hypothetical protein AAF449_20350, partial [Myxococcota bacterium]